MRHIAKIEIAKRNVDDAVVCNAEALPFHDNSIDLILCVEVIEHVINPANLLKELNGYYGLEENLY